jgi:hypothetical protein
MVNKKCTVRFCALRCFATTHGAIALVERAETRDRSAAIAQFFRVFVTLTSTHHCALREAR